MGVALSQTRSMAVVQVYLIIRDGEKILLSLRQNTGYNDGMYAFVAGHVEEGEAAHGALIREAEEEAGIVISAADIRVCHVMHRKTNRNNIDIFFECAKWQGSLTNMEPDKCKELGFFPIDQLPDNTIAYIVKAIQAIRNGQFYAEDGW